MMMSKRSTKWASEDAPPPSPESVRGRALALLTQREHGRAELAGKLTAWGANPEQVEILLVELGERGLQDDTRFAEVYIRSRRVRGYGPLVISQELRQRGLDPELVKQQIDEGEFDWQEEACAVRQRRFGSTVPRDRRVQAKQLRFLQYRGFSSAQAVKALRGADLEDLTEEE